VVSVTCKELSLSPPLGLAVLYTAADNRRARARHTRMNGSWCSMIIMSLCVLCYVIRLRVCAILSNLCRTQNAQGRAKQKAYRGQTKRNYKPVKRVEYNAYQAKQGESIPLVFMGETQPLCTGAREPGCEQTRKDDQGQLHLSPLLGLADHAWQNHARQTRRR
jgi:hypothetical protein